MVKIKSDMSNGYVHTNRRSHEFEIINYISAHKVQVRFLSTGYITFAEAGQIRKGSVKDILSPSMCGIGYIGIGSSKVCTSKGLVKAYSTWSAMINRCYNEAKYADSPAYIGCTVDPVWHNYQNFAKWFDDNYIEGYQLDKDLLHQGNKVYSTDNCIFVPQEINKLLTDHGAARGNCKVGVHWCYRDSRYISRCNVGGNRVTIGSFSTEESAHEAYKKFKYAVIKEVAEKQTEPLRSALLAYRIEGTTSNENT